MSKLNQHHQRNHLLRLIIILFLLCVVTIGFLGFRVIHQQVEEMIGPANPGMGSGRVLYYDLFFLINTAKILTPNTASGDLLFSIESGQPVDDIITALASEGFISDEGLFRSMLVYTGGDQRILPGTYRFPQSSTMRDVLLTLQDPNAGLIDFVILPGWRKEEIANALPTSGLSITMEDFLASSSKPVEDLEIVDPLISSYEGFLAPGNYAFHRNITTEQFLSSFITRFKKNATKDLQDAFTSNGLSLYQAVTLASIVQREAILDEEKPLIASVFYNRLRIGMQLQTDPTVQYAIGYTPDWGWWKSPLTYSDLEVNSVYNTYMISGLPPTPICNPDEKSINAVAYPAQSSYLYFRAACDNSGRHEFSETIEEHTMNGCENSGS